MFSDTIVILRAPTITDRYNSTVADWANAAEIEVPFLVSVQPAGSTEGGARPVTVTTNWRIFTPAGTDLDLQSTDRVKWAGRDLEVVGEIARWPHPIIPGAVHHVEVEVQKVSS
ncbi:hypothetical protein [Rhodococcus daqingensis]|uniref:Head-tail adaptor protein n=1 Tax=Rhodococcus daqingensis TaxID=2479363 RepID=A0ABW2S4Q9_9NOCA